MFLMRFTERAYVNYTEEDVRNSPNEAVRLTFSNSNFDPQEGHYLYNMYLDEYEYSEEVGFDGLMLNEHHNTPTCLGATMNLEAAILARNTKNSKIVLLGNPLPIFDNPIRLAEELAEIDMISGGRLVSGFRARHRCGELWPPTPTRCTTGLASKKPTTWSSRPGPRPAPSVGKVTTTTSAWSIRSRLPMQKPHPPVWIPGTGSPETLVWCAERNYPYIFLETDPQGTQDMKAIYAETARQHGYEPGPENFGYLVRIHVQDTDEKAYDVGKGYMVGNIGVGRIPLPRDYASPVGYGSRSDDPRFLRLREQVRSDPFRVGGLDGAAYDSILDSKRWIIGSPDTVISQLREVLSFMRPGILAVWTNDGSISHEDTMRCLELMGQEVLPALREIGEELELTDPFQKEGAQPGLTRM